MELLFNDLSLHGQFNTPAEFEESIGRVMEMREAARRLGLEVHCPRSIADAPRVVGDMPMRQAVQHLDRSTLSALMVWLDAHGPFMDDIRQHRGPEDSLDLGDKDGVVTNTAVGEAAYCRFKDMDCRLVSLSPSSWNFSPVRVVLRKSRGRTYPLAVENYWERAALQQALEDAAPPARPMGTWGDLEEKARKQYPALTFSADAFKHIRPHPFVPGAAERILRILRVLHDLKHSFNEQGGLTSEGMELYNLHFFGDKALFSDSSDTEKAQFQQELTFPNPYKAGERLFCTWHGKVKSTVPIRVHYHWNISADEPVYVMYVGPKITKR